MNGWKIRLTLLAGLTIILTWLVSVASAALPALRFCWNVDGKEVSVQLYEKKDHTLCLFLPGALKGRNPTVRITGNRDLIWDGETYPDGSEFPAETFLDRQVQAHLSTETRVYNVQVMQGSAIPALFFTVDEDDYKRVLKGTRFDIKKEAGVVMLEPDGSINAAEALTSFKTHGNSTYFASKKPFQFKMEHKVSLAGMEKNKKWMLLANWFDISLIRNQITFDLCREIGLTSTPDCRQVDLYINEAYNGTYLLTEKIQLKKGRLEINDLEEAMEELNGKEAYSSARFKKGSGQKIARILKWFDQKQEPEDVTGGYLLEIEKALHFKLMDDIAGFVTDNGMCVVIKEPTYAGRKEVEYIAGLVTDFHNAVLAADGVNKKGRHYTSYMDVNSFALKITVEEFSANYDVRAGSHFMYKDSDSVDGLLYAGPGWDYDLTYGNKDDGLHNPLKKDFVFKRSNSQVFLYHWLLTHDDFRAAARKLYDGVFLPAAEVLAGRREPAEGCGLKSVAAYQEEIRESAAMNFSRWTARAIPDVWDPSGRTFEDSGAFVINWINQRMDMMTESWLLEGAAK